MIRPHRGLRQGVQVALLATTGAVIAGASIGLAQGASPAKQVAEVTSSQTESTEPAITTSVDTDGGGDGSAEVTVVGDEHSAVTVDATTATNEAGTTTEVVASSEQITETETSGTGTSNTTVSSSQRQSISQTTSGSSTAQSSSSSTGSASTGSQSAGPSPSPFPAAPPPPPVPPPPPLP